MSIFKNKQKSLGLALGGGAARGLAHIGILKVLAEEEIRIDFIAGTSAGSIIGGLTAYGYSWQDIYDVACKINWSSLAAPALGKMGLLRFDKFEAQLSDLTDNTDFFRLTIPFKAVSVDIVKGEEFVISHGNLARAVRASCSIPGIFSPLEWDKKLLVDGGVLNDIPANVVREMGADVVMGVNLNAGRVKDQAPDNIFEVISTSLHIMMQQRNIETAEESDIFLSPELSGFNFVDLKNIDELVRTGETAMRERMADLKKLLRLE